ncbi:MAG TPA: thiamine pyrophosphate-dependent enzyme, partial [Stellaceae bacterium]|nr:thiamine pyrophosphate-dependent enzyme [Stellaceae bacterium]
KLPAARGRIDVDPATEHRSYPSEVFVAGDARRALEALAARLDGRMRIDPAFAADIAAARREAEAGLRRTAGAYAPMLDVLERAMPRDALWVRDITLANTIWGNRAPAIRDPRNSILALGGGIGQGLAMAVGAALGGGGRKTVALIGDGGLQLGLGELATLAETRADVVLLLMTDGGYGVIRNMQDNDYGGRRCYADLKTPNFGMVAEALGIPHRPVRAMAGFAPAFAEALAMTGPVILELDMAAIGPFGVRAGGFPPAPAWAGRR